MCVFSYVVIVVVVTVCSLVRILCHSSACGDGLCILLCWFILHCFPTYLYIFKVCLVLLMIIAFSGFQRELPENGTVGEARFSGFSLPQKSKKKKKKKPPCNLSLSSIFLVHNLMQSSPKLKYLQSPLLWILAYCFSYLLILIQNSYQIYFKYWPSLRS